jgi:hypothetical protein
MKTRKWGWVLAAAVALAAPASVPWPARGASSGSGVYVFPNPARKVKPTFHVRSTGAERVLIRIYDLMGRRVHEAELTGSPSLVTRAGVQDMAYEYAWDYKEAASGVYLYTVTIYDQGTGIWRGKFALVR